MRFFPVKSFFGEFNRYFKQTQYLSDLSCSLYADMQAAVNREVIHAGLLAIVKNTSFESDDKEDIKKSILAKAEQQNLFDFYCFNSNAPFRPFEYNFEERQLWARSEMESYLNSIFINIRDRTLPHPPAIISQEVSAQEFYVSLVLQARAFLVYCYDLFGKLLHLSITEITSIPLEQNMESLNEFLNDLQQTVESLEEKLKGEPNSQIEESLAKLKIIITNLQQLKESTGQLLDHLTALPTEGDNSIDQYSEFLDEQNLKVKRIQLMEQRERELKELFQHKAHNPENQVAIDLLQTRFQLIEASYNDNLQDKLSAAQKNELEYQENKLNKLLQELAYPAKFILQEQHGERDNIAVLTLLRCINEHVAQKDKSETKQENVGKRRTSALAINDIRNLFKGLLENLQSAREQALIAYKTHYVYQKSTTCYLTARKLKPAMENQYILAAINILFTLVCLLGLIKKATTGCFYFYSHSITQETMFRNTPLGGTKRLRGN